MSTEAVTALDQFTAPYGREVTLQDVSYESGLRMLRLRIREGRRFTIMEVDAATARHWSKVMGSWAEGSGA